MSVIHVLRPESVTPIGRYLDRARASAGDHDCWLDLACLLLYREREYRAMTGAPWTPERLPRAGAGLGFAPFDLTPDAQSHIAAVAQKLGSGEAPGDAPEDLFGLKAEVLAGLQPTLRPRKSHAFAHLVGGVLARDLCRYDDALTLVDRAVNTMNDAVAALALTWSVAVRAPRLEGGLDTAAVVMQAEKRARRLLTGQRRRHDWHWRALEQLDERIRRRALTVRRQAEGATFTRYLASEMDFCAREHAAALDGFDERVVPEEVRELIPLARRFGIGDDSCRALVIRRTRAAERRIAAAAVAARADRVEAWLTSQGGPPYGREAACFFWLLEAAEEMRPVQRS